MFRNKAERKGDGVETIIGPTVRVDGKFVGKGNVVIQGSVSGSVRTTEDVHIDSGAVVKANVEARNVHVAGEVQGNVKARERLEMEPTAKIIGDVEAKTIAIGGGAVLNGRCMMIDGGTATAEEQRTQTNGKGKNGRRVDLPV